jgi:two-component system response regulator FixJ
VPMEVQPNVYVLDDNEAVRKGISLLIKSVGLNVETYASAREFLEEFEPESPGCLVLDVRMPGMSGTELQEMLSAKKINIPVIMISGHGDIDMAVHAVKRGAVTFLEKPFREQALLDSIRQALDQDTQIRQKQAETDAIKQKMAILTPREQQVMEHVVEGKANKVIARELGLSQKTIEFHRGHIMEKMQVESVAQLVHLYLAVKES